jgi:hypothetical protein
MFAGRSKKLLLIHLANQTEFQRDESTIPPPFPCPTEALAKVRDNDIHTGKPGLAAIFKPAEQDIPHIPFSLESVMAEV